MVDWFRLHFRNRSEIEAFIRLNEFHLDNERDVEHLDHIKHRALAYLHDHLKYRRVPEVVVEADVVALLEFASGKGRRAHRYYACLVLKVMHLLHYITAHELSGALPVTQAEVAVLLHAKVERVVRGLFERNFPIVEFSGNTKTHHSVVSKLLAKKESQATQVFDKLRFRFIVARLEDIPPLLVALLRELVPFNYTVPAQANNTLVDLPSVLVRAGNLHAIRAQSSRPTAPGAQDDRLPATGAQAGPPTATGTRGAGRASKGDGQLNEPMAAFETGRRNDLSGPDYRVVNFVAEVPIRLDGVIWDSAAAIDHRGPVGFGTVEFQVVDQETSRRNETGPNRHALYKNRQRTRVRDRLEHGKRGLRSRDIDARERAEDANG